MIYLFYYVCNDLKGIIKINGDKEIGATYLSCQPVIIC